MKLFMALAIKIANKPQRPNSRGRHGRSILMRGTGLLEFAILIPMAMVIVSLFFDSMMLAISKVVHHSVMIQISSANKKAALRASAGTVEGIPTMNINRLTPTQLTGTSGLFTEINAIFESYMGNWGTGSNYFVSGLAQELWYARICTDTLVPCDHKALGDAVAMSAAEAADGNPILFYTTAASENCFGRPNSATRNDIEAQFSAYVAAQRRLILFPPQFPGDHQPAFGTKLIDVQTGFNPVGTITEFLDWKPVMFIALCSIPPTLWGQKQPVVTFQTYFPDKEVSYG